MAGTPHKDLRFFFITHYQISGYYLTELPDNLALFRNGPLGSMAPHAMTKYALDQARAQNLDRAPTHAFSKMATLL